MAAQLMNDTCRCTGDSEVNGEVKVCPARNQCLRSIKESGCEALIKTK